MRDRFAGVAFGWNNAQCAFLCDLLSNLGAAVSLVGDDGERRFIPVQKCVHHLTVMDVASRYREPQGTAMGIYSGVNLARAATS